MIKRIISGVLGLPLLIGIVLLGGVYLKAGVAILSLIGMYEFYKAVSKRIMPVHTVGFAMCIFYIATLGIAKADVIYSDVFRYFLLIAVMVIMIIQIAMHNKINIHDTAATIFGFFYIGFMFSNVILIRSLAYGQYFVWLIFISAFCCDTGAYFVGISMGKHKLAPVLSPKKTIEGAVGGILCASLVSGIYGFIITKAADIPKDLPMIAGCIFIGFVGAVMAELGDLAASSIKRYTGIKDFGNIMPGHGGVLDRFDSVIFTSATVYLLCILMLKL